MAALSERALSGADACELFGSAAPAVGQAISADRVEIHATATRSRPGASLVAGTDPVVFEIRAATSCSGR